MNAADPQPCFSEKYFFAFVWLSLVILLHCICYPHRYDLPDGGGVGLVSFSNTSRLEFPLTALADTRARLADSVPDKYR